MKFGFNDIDQRKNERQVEWRAVKKFASMLMILVIQAQISLSFKGIHFISAYRVRWPDLDTVLAYYGGCPGFSGTNALSPYDAAECLAWCETSNFCAVPLSTGDIWCA